MPYGAKNGTVNGTDPPWDTPSTSARRRPRASMAPFRSSAMSRMVKPSGRAFLRLNTYTRYAVDGMCLWSLPITAAEVVLLLLSMIPVERALKENFDENGRRR